ncbi:MAG TPA: class D sortase [Candidatus Limnocylindrales bacterium]|nr:class D sortase [Candidatus Limnocylindrales bacterium]
MQRTSRFLSYLLIFGGAVLLFLGGREVWDSHAGQVLAAREFARNTGDSAGNAADGSASEASDSLTVTSYSAPQPGEAMAKLSIPRLDTQLYVVEGDGEKQLRRGPGHLSGSAMPGADGNCIIAGHRDTHFRILKDIRKGDDIVLETRAGEFLYRVTAMSVVSPKNTKPLQPSRDARLNLITCYPFYYVGSAPRRFVVQAELVGSVAGTQPGSGISESNPGS